MPRLNKAPVSSVAKAWPSTAFDGRAYSRLLARVTVHRHSAVRDLARMREIGRGEAARNLAVR